MQGTTAFTSCTKPRKLHSPCGEIVNASRMINSLPQNERWLHSPCGEIVNASQGLDLFGQGIDVAVAFPLRGDCKCKGYLF